MGTFQPGDHVKVLDFATRAPISEHLPDLPVLEIVRQMPNSVAERGQVEYELSSGALVPEHQLVLVEAVGAGTPEPESAPEPEPESVEQPARRR